MITDIRMAALGTNIFLIYIGILVLPKPSIYRPHPLFWRTIQSLAFTYLINIIFLLFFSYENIKYILTEVIDPNLKNTNLDRDYALDCRIYTPENPNSNFANILPCFDVYITCHFFGWLVKSGIFRNQVFGWFLGIGFELLELTFKNWLPNFNECWWDSLLLDLFGMNLLGMIVGNWIINTFEITKYHWFMEPDNEMEKMTNIQKLKYFFTARKVYKESGKWHILSSARNFLHVIWFMAFI